MNNIGQNKSSRPWSLSKEDILRDYSTSEKGLTRIDALFRLEKNGRNELPGKEKKKAAEIFLSQFSNALVLVLIAAAAISFFLAEYNHTGEYTDSFVIFFIVLLNAVLGFIQEYKAEKALRELRKYVTLQAKVDRDGEISELDARELVTGDIIYLDIGDMVPADIRLLSADELSADESTLTGESIPVEKNAGVIDSSCSSPQDLTNMVFMGTIISAGNGHGIVTATAQDTFFGKTAAYLRQTEPVGDFQKNIGIFSNFLLKVTLVMTVFIFGANAYLGKNVMDSFLFAIALAVGITPEVLPIIITIALSTGALKMAEKKVIVKRLASVEDLGNIDTLCCDKTGTLTEGELSVLRYVDYSGKKEEDIIIYGLLCNSVKVRKGRKAFGNPIDRAIWRAPDAKALEHRLRSFIVLEENEFDYHRRRMSVLARTNEGNVLIVKGAPESIIDACRDVFVNGKNEPFNQKVSAAYKEKIEGYEKEGYIVIAVASKKMDRDNTTHVDETELTFRGFLLFLDLPKKTVKESIKTLHRLDVNVKILSGDSQYVTKKVCQEVGLPIVEDQVVTGDDLSKLGDREFEEYSLRYNVFARVTPEQKHMIVSCLRKRGHIVGFMGDGVNDAPALQAADVGISVDSATGVAKEASDIILLKKSLYVLADGIKAGRKTFANINKYIFNTVSANFGNMFTVAASSLFLKFIPLLPSQILLNNLVSDAPLLTVSTDKVDEDLLKKPRRWDIHAIYKFMIFFGLISTFFDLALIGTMILVVKASPELFRTAWFLESSLSEIIVTFAIRTKLPFYKSRPSSLLLGTSVLTVAGAIALTYSAFGAEYFKFVQMPAGVLAIITGILLCYFASAEIAKHYYYKRFKA
ncbi:MAG: magnesium-translocating P-type ATPase [Candidatus Altiarchaeia archaeon]